MATAVNLMPPRSRPAGVLQSSEFIIVEQPRPHQEAHAFAVFQREHATAPRHHIDDELGVLPIFELRRADVERRAANLASNTSRSPTMNSPTAKHIGEEPSQQPPD